MDVLLWFPKDPQGFADAGAWFAKAAEHVLAWHRAGRLSESVEKNLLSALVLRLHDHDEREHIPALIAALRKMAGARSSDLLWVVDAARYAGDRKTAYAIELALFDKGRLHVERVPGVIADITTEQGPRAALAFADQATEITLHPDLLQNLVHAAARARDVVALDEWALLQEEAKAAEAKLKELDRKRAEAAKKAREAAKKAQEAAKKTRGAGKRATPTRGARRR